MEERVRRWPERWKQEGRLEGRQETLQTQKRFEAEVATLAGVRLEAIADPERLEELAEALFDCVSGEAWLERIGRPLN